MEFIIKNTFRLILVSIYPIILILSFLYLYKKNKIKTIIKNNYKYIILNTLIAVSTITIGLLVFFYFENTIYSYDNSGYWVRTLKLRQLFFDNPFNILQTVFNSMNNDDYSYLISLFSLGPIIISQSYVFYCISNLLLFLVPTLFLLQILYYRYFNNKFLPALIFLGFYPLWLTIFYGKPDCIGLFFLLFIYILALFQEYDSITFFDNLLINFFSFLLIFSRRWYLYALVGFYIVYFLRTLFYSKNNKINLLKFISSGIFLFFILILFFRPYLYRVINNSFEDTYTYYNHDNKLLSVINFYSVIISCISIYGFYKIIKNRKFHLSIYLLLLIILPTALFWRIQSFDFHHFYLITLPILLLFIYGLESFKYKNTMCFILCPLLILQTLFIFIDIQIPLFTTTKKFPEKHKYKNQLKEVAYYLKNIETEDWMSAYVASGSYLICDDMIRNSILPDIDAPVIDSAVLDLRDGFPRNFSDIKYILVITPTQYLERNQQHMYDVISDAITSNSVVSDAYEPIKIFVMDESITITVYERTKPLTKEMKQYLYDEMIKYYPDKIEEYKYILN